MIKLLLTLFVLQAISVSTYASSHLQGSNTRLGSYSIEAKSTTISGISSGAFMATQMEIAFSRTIFGAGTIAGGIYGCAEGSSQTAQTTCMALPKNIQVPKYINQAKKLAESGQIDDLKYLADHRLYIFAGTKDTLVNPLGSTKLKEFYKDFVDAINIQLTNQVEAVHGFPTLEYGNPCNVQTTPWIINCGFDTAGEILKTMYGELQPRGEAVKSHLHQFSQEEFATSDSSLYASGWIYVPSACEQGESCKLHVALHGCAMNPDSIKDQFVLHAGYNEWAETNQIIILYPQAEKIRATNPYGCWDWYGYTGKNYATRNGPQMIALKMMIDRVSSQHSAPSASKKRQCCMAD